MQSKVIDNSINSLAALGIAGASLAVASVLQLQSPGFILRGVAILGFWVLVLLMKGITLPRCVLMISTMFLHPFELAFYFSLAMLVLVLIADKYHTKDKKLLLSYPLSFFTLLVFGFISLSKTYVSGGFIYFMASIIVPLICFLVIENSRSDQPAMDLWMRGISIVAVIVAVYGIYVALANPFDRIGSTWSNAMTINGFYGLAFFFSLALSFKAEQSTSRLLWVAAAILIFLGMMFTYTRIAMLAVVFGLGLLVFKYRRIRLWGIVAIGLIPLLIPSSMMQRGSVDGMVDISILIRLAAWYHAAFVIAANPITGIGFSTWMETYRDMIPLPMLYAQHAHNVYINLLLEIGIIGTIAYLSIIYKSLRLYYSNKVKPKGDMVAFCVWVGMLSLMFACLTDIFIQQYTVSLLFWISLALMVKESSVKQPSDPNS